MELKNEWKHGMKSGAVAGAMYGILAGAIALVYMIVMREEIMLRIQAAIPSGTSIPISVEQLYGISMAMSLPSSVMMGAICGLVFGFIFAVMKPELMGKGSKKQGMFLSLLMLVAFAIGEGLVPENPLSGFFLIRFSYLPLAPVSALAFVALGYLTGTFWDRFGKNSRK